MSSQVVYGRAMSILRVLCVASPCFALGLVGSPAFAQLNVQGEWVAPPGGDPPPYGWLLTARDAAPLSTGKVLVWAATNADPQDAKLWNPGDGSFTEVDCTVCVGSLHCPGHAFMMDGSLLAAGGGGDTSEAHDETRIFRAVTEQWEKVADMNHARWYPTCTTLPNGHILAVTGIDSMGFTVARPEI